MTSPMHPTTTLADPARVPVGANPDPTIYEITEADGVTAVNLTDHDTAILQWWDIATPTNRHDDAMTYATKADGEVLVTWSDSTIHASEGTKLYRIWSTDGTEVVWSGLFERRVGPDVAPTF